DREDADEPEVDVDDRQRRTVADSVAGFGGRRPSISTEVDEQVLASGLGVVEDVPVDEGGLLGEPALRAADLDPLAAEHRAQVRAEAEQGMTFGHYARLKRRCLQRRGRPQEPPEARRCPRSRSASPSAP